jgi:nucleoid-associated protein YgaU
MGIFDSFKKKSASSKTEAEPDVIEAVDSSPATESVSEEPSGPEPAAAVEPIANVEPEPAPTDASGRSYTVQSGDTLWNIAEQMYGDGSKYMKIFDANADLLEQPDRVLPDQELFIPD